MERAYLIVKEFPDPGVLPKTIDLRVILNDLEGTYSQDRFTEAVGLEDKKLRKKYPKYRVDYYIHPDLSYFCREFPAAAAKYIEEKSTVEVKASDILKKKSN